MKETQKSKQSSVSGGFKAHLPSSQGKPTTSQDYDHRFSGKAASDLKQGKGWDGRKFKADTGC